MGISVFKQSEYPTKSQKLHSKVFRKSVSSFLMMPPVSQFKRFDARTLIRKGVEPFPEIRKRVDMLRPGEGLIVVAPFLPSPLVEKLSSEGFGSKVERGQGSDWVVYFWREAE